MYTTLKSLGKHVIQTNPSKRERERDTERETERETQRERQREREREIIFIVRPPAHNNRSEHSGISNSRGSNDGLKHSFLVFKAFKNKDRQFFKSMAGAFVPANNKENFSSSLKAVCFGHTNKKIKKYFCFWSITECTIYIPVCNDISLQTFQF